MKPVPQIALGLTGTVIKRFSFVIALVLLTHQPSVCVNRMVDYWRSYTNPDHVVVAYGGPEKEFPEIQGKKVFVTDPRLRTKDHQRELQSYTNVLRAAVTALEGNTWDELYFGEFDMLPLVPDLWGKLRSHSDSEDADLLGYRLWQINDTLHPHYLYHLANRPWMEWLRSLSVRSDKSVILSCLGCGQYWRKNALLSVIEKGEPFPAYLELHLPSLAHHLGFRVRGMGGQDDFVKTEIFTEETKQKMITDGAWIIHPDKSLWQSS